MRGFCCGRHLRREHVLDFRRSDAEGQRAEGAVRGSVAVAANDGQARLRHAQLGPDDVHDALVGRVDVVKCEPELLAVVPQRFHLARRDGIGDRKMPGRGRNVVVHRDQRTLRLPDATARGAQAVKRLRRRDLVYQVQIDVE